MSVDKDYDEVWGLSPIEVHRDTLDALAYIMESIEQAFSVPRELIKRSKPSDHRTESELMFHDQERL